jgi:L-asparaginase II
MVGESNPVLVEVTRGGRVESFHRGRVVVVGRAGKLELALGDVDAAVFWRSAAKPFQTAAALKAGVAERFGLTPEDIALVSASHNGEDAHADGAARLLAYGGIADSHLHCGPHPSIAPKVAYQLAARGIKPTRLRSNCSGKHAGMLLFASALGAELGSYTNPDHPVQRAIRSAIAAIAEVGDGRVDELGVDGCSAPTFALPLSNLAIAFRNLALAGAGLNGTAQEFERELVRVREAMTTHPYLVAGLGRFDTELMTVTRGAIVSKIGAEGVIACGIPRLGLGVAIKCDDGSPRGYEPLVVELLARFGVLTGEMRTALVNFENKVLRNFAGQETGATRVQLP